MTTATMTSSTGAAIAIFRRTARSCAAPLASHAAQRSSNVADSVMGVDLGVPGGATTVDTVMAMGPSRLQALVRAGPEWPRAQKSSSLYLIRSSTVLLDL